jgi:hypothetical protein
MLAQPTAHLAALGEEAGRFLTACNGTGHWR